MAVASASPAGPSAAYYWKTEAQGRDQYYQPALLAAPDRWLWDVLLSREIKHYSVEIDLLAPSLEPGRLSVWLQGASDLEVAPDHHVRVSVNGMEVAEGRWDGHPRTASTESCRRERSLSAPTRSRLRTLAIPMRRTRWSFWIGSSSTTHDRLRRSPVDSRADSHARGPPRSWD